MTTRSSKSKSVCGRSNITPNKKNDLSYLLNEDYHELDFLRDYDLILESASKVLEDFLDPPFLFSFLLQEIFRTVFKWIEDF